MSRGRAISLSDRQLAAVVTAAPLLPPRGRSRFLSNFAEAADAEDLKALLRSATRELPIALKAKPH